MLRLVAEKTRAKKKKKIPSHLSLLVLYNQNKRKTFLATQFTSFTPLSKTLFLHCRGSFFFFFSLCFLSNQIINGLFGDSVWVTLFEFFLYTCGWKCVLCCLKCVFCFWVVLPNMPQISKNGKVMTFYFIWMLFLMFDFKWSLGLVIELNLELVWAMKSKMSIVEH